MGVIKRLARQQLTSNSGSYCKEAKEETYMPWLPEPGG